ncbi:MAG: MBL fold metallo-hydrolase [Flavisolibacter sp.]
MGFLCSMSLFITSLNSGSNGNCYYVGTEREAILVDAGISCREIEKRMKRLGLSMDKVRAVFISHEHSDHIRGLETLSKKFHLPVFITRDTLRFGRLRLEPSRTFGFQAGEVIQFGELSVTAFSKLHDAADPFSFLVSSNGVSVGVFTDIGKPCEQVIHHFKQCHAAFLESNYDDHLLEQGNYPHHLKRRIRSEHGHLSNQQALQLFLEHRPSFMNHLILSHLSQNNNCPKLVEELFVQHACGVRITVASRYQETDLFPVVAANAAASLTYSPTAKPEQLEFSFS